MREIKFRAFNRKARKNKWMNVISVWLSDKGTVSHVFGYVLVGESQTWFDNFELMQYTGLKDKNGKEIYEGDICQFKNKYMEDVSEVKWRHESAGWNIDNRYLEDTEVIGNIYENPDLLK